MWAAVPTIATLGKVFRRWVSALILRLAHRLLVSQHGKTAFNRCPRGLLSSIRPIFLEIVESASLPSREASLLLQVMKEPCRLTTSCYELLRRSEDTEITGRSLYSLQKEIFSEKARLVISW